MTAIVGTLNRKGIAFAADSAATLITASTNKITNNTTKIFELSKYNPVGIAIYNNLDFYGIPWETIIKMFRDNYLKDKKFPELSGYAIEFENYLRSFVMHEISVEDQDRQIAEFVNGLKDEIFAAAEDVLTERGEEVSSPAMFEEMSEFLKKVTDTYCDLPITSSYTNFTREMMDKRLAENVDAIMEEWFKDDDCPKDFRELFLNAMYHIMIVDRSVYLLNTGLVFWGFGENELFPSYYCYEVSLVIDDYIKIVNVDSYSVTNSYDACVVPFAQTDVVNTVMRGIDPNLRVNLCDSLGGAFNDLRNSIIDKLVNAGVDDKTVEEVRGMNVDSRVAPFMEKLDTYIQDNYIDRLLEIVALLSKEDLADMAESLVRITSLKRHVTTDQDSVGGPVDVAVITKGDGFVWIKCKQYFPPELNRNYFERNKFSV